VWHYTTRAIEELGLDEDKVLWVGGQRVYGKDVHLLAQGLLPYAAWKALSFAPA